MQTGVRTGAPSLQDRDLGLGFKVSGMGFRV